MRDISRELHRELRVEYFDKYLCIEIIKPLLTSTKGIQPYTDLRNKLYIELATQLEGLLSDPVLGETTRQLQGDQFGASINRRLAILRSSWR
jgi:hypothetical protein